MDSIDDKVARTRAAREARAKVPKDSVRGRSRAVYEVLFCLASAETPLTQREIAEIVGLGRSNTARILASLDKYGQVVHGDPGHERRETVDGRIIPVWGAWEYVITDRGICRMGFLEDTEPWNPKDNEE